MRFSIIIPTYNEAKNIVSLLDQIKHLVADDTEIIIVDDNSPDGTADIVRKYNINVYVSKYFTKNILILRIIINAVKVIQHVN